MQNIFLITHICIKASTIYMNNGEARIIFDIRFILLISKIIVIIMHIIITKHAELIFSLNSLCLDIGYLCFQ